MFALFALFAVTAGLVAGNPLEDIIAGNLSEASRPKICGVNKYKAVADAGFEPYIIGGIVAKPNFYPWQVSLQYQVSATSARYCGGSIISDRWILTAAHCFSSTDVLSRWRVLAGKHQLSKTEPGQQMYGVSAFIVHENYNKPSQFNNDVAVIKVDRAITFTDNIQPICITEPNVGSLVGSDVTISGWGGTSTAGGISDVLMQVTLKVVDSSKCSKMYSTKMTDGMICEGNSGPTLETPFKGDSGGPVARKVGGAWTQVGIVSWGAATPTITVNLAVSTRVSYYIGWINKQTGLGFNSASGLVPKNRILITCILLASFLFSA